MTEFILHVKQITFKQLLFMQVNVNFLCAHLPLKILEFGKIWGSCGGEYGNNCHLGYCAMSSVSNIRMTAQHHVPVLKLVYIVIINL